MEPKRHGNCENGTKRRERESVFNDFELARISVERFDFIGLNGKRIESLRRAQRDAKVSRETNQRFHIQTPSEINHGDDAVTERLTRELGWARSDDWEERGVREEIRAGRDDETVDEVGR